MGRGRRFIGAGAAAGIAIGIAAGWALGSQFTGAFVLKELVPRVNAAIPGKITIGTLRLSRSFKAELDDVDIRAPDGAEALHAEHLSVAVDPVRWVTRHEHSLGIEAEGVETSLVPDSSGRAAIVRALVDPSKQSGGKSTLVLDLDARVKRAHVSVPKGDLRVDDSVLAVAVAPSALGIAFEGVGAESGEPLSARVNAKRRGVEWTVTLARVSQGGSRASADALVADADAPRGSASAWITPALVARFADMHPKRAIEAHGEADAFGNGRTRLSARAAVEGGGSALLEGAWRARALSARVDATGVDPQAWGFARAPRASLGARASLDRAASGAIAVVVEDASGTIGRARLSTLRLAATRSVAGAIAVRLTRAEALDPAGGAWALAGESNVRYDAGVTSIDSLTLRGPARQRVAVSGEYPALHSNLRARARLALPGLAGELVPSLARVSGDLRAFAELSPDRANAGRAWLRLDGATLDGRALPRDILVTAAAIGDRALVTADAANPGHARLHAEVPVPRGRACGWSCSAALGPSSLELSADALALPDLPPLDARARAGARDGHAWASVDATSRGADLLRAAASAAIPRGVFSDAIARVSELHLAPLADGTILPRDTEGTISGLVSVTNDRRLTASLSLRDGRVRDERALAGTVVVHGDRTLLHADVTLATPDGARVAVAAAIDPAHPRDARAVVSGAGLRLAQAATGGDAPREMRSRPSLDGYTDLFASGSISDASVLAVADSLSWGGEPLGFVVAAARIEPARAEMWIAGEPVEKAQVLAHSHLAATVRLRGRAPLLSTWRTAALSGVIEARRLPLGPFAQVNDTIESLDGRLDARVALRGTIADLDPIADLHVIDGAIAHPEIGHSGGIEIAVSGDRNRIVLSELRATAHGTLDASATATREAKIWKLAGKVDASRFGLDGRRFAGIVDARATVAGNLEGPKLYASVAVASGTVRLPSQPSREPVSLADHPDFVVVGLDSSARIQTVAGVEPRAPIAATLHLSIPDGVRVVGNDIDALVRGDVTLTSGAEKAPLLIEGEVETIRAEASVAGKKFEVEHAHVGFPGGPPSMGRIDVRARHDQGDVDETKVYAIVGGTVGAPHLTLESDPPLPQDAIASLLLLGSTDPRAHSQGASSPSLAGRAVTFVGNVLTSELRRRLTTVIPVDVLELEPGAAGSSAAGRVRVGKYVAPGLFLSYAHAFAAAPGEGTNAVQLQWRFHRVWQLLGELTDENRASFDVVWTHDF